MSSWNVLSAVSALWLLGAAPSPPAQSAFERGEKALAAGQLEDAAASYSEALRATPGYAEALNGLGSVYFKQGKREQAIRQFRMAINADTNFKLAYFNLGYACRKTGDYPSAQAAYERYLQLDPNDADGVFGLAESFRFQGQNANAIAQYQRYVQMEKRPSEQAWVEKARGYVAELQRSNVPASTRDAGTTLATSGALTVKKDRTPAERITDADRLMAQNQPGDAIALYDSALRDEPGNLEALFKSGNAFARQGSFNVAIERWTQVTQRATDPGVKASAQQNIDRARAKLASSSPPAAVAPAPIAVPPPPAHSASRAAYEQGVRQINARDFAGAYQSLSQAIQAEPSLAVAYVARGSAQVGLQHFNEAALDYQRALSLDPQKASPLYGLAESYRALGRKADAKAYYQRYAESIAPDVRIEQQVLARQKAASL